MSHGVKDLTDASAKFYQGHLPRHQINDDDARPTDVEFSDDLTRGSLLTR